MTLKILLSFLFIAVWLPSAPVGDAAAAYSKWHGLAARFSPRLKVLDSRLEQIEGEMRALPIMSDLDSRGTHGFHSNFILTSEENWFEVGWAKPQIIDGIGMVPTRIITQSGIRSNYGLPAKMRIEAIGPGSDKPFVIAQLDDTRLDLRRGEPIFLNVPATLVTSLRFIPVDLPTLPGKTVRFFSLAEVMVYQGDQNVMHKGKLRANYSINTEVGWNLSYLVDSQSPLGPPELPVEGHSLGWHAETRPTESPCWAVIDLGTPKVFDSVCLVGARGDAPIKGPGFGFPVRFRFEVSDDLQAGPWRAVWTTGDEDYDNPGYNRTIARFAPVTARYVRLVVTKRHAPDRFAAPRVLLSEFEVWHEGRNIAFGAPVVTSDRIRSIPHDATRVWSGDGLTDGFSSTGLLIPERQWVASLSRRFDLTAESQELRAEREQLLVRWQQWTLAVIFLVLGAVIFGLMFWQVRLRMANRKTMTQLRNRISSDLHDEVGSNLATIALLSELEPAASNLEDIHRLSLETSLSLREIVEISIASKRARKPLMERVREIASLMLREHEWTLEGAISPELDLDRRRHLVFFFKEALHNIIRHAGARKVSVSFETSRPYHLLTVEDDGKGMHEPSADMMGDLRTLHQRAAALSGKLEVRSEPGHGTKLHLKFPIQSPSKS